MEKNSRPKELLNLINEETIIDKNVKLFNELRKAEMEKTFNRHAKQFEKPNGVSMRFFVWTMFAMAIIGLIASIF